MDEALVDASAARSDRHPVAPHGYDPYPAYRLTHGAVTAGYRPLADELRQAPPRVLALDGPAAFDWATFVERLRGELDRHGVRTQTLDVREHHPDWAQVQRRTEQSDLPGDPNFARLATGKLDELFDDLPPAVVPEPGGTLIVFGPGSALVSHDRLWLVDRPKRHTLVAVQRGLAPNLGQPADQPGSQKRHLFIDWPLLDRHRDTLFEDFHRFVDGTDIDEPRSVDGDDLRATLAVLAVRPVRTLPSYLPGAWGGQWLRRNLGVEPDAPNIAIGYELIAPEATVAVTSSSDTDTDTGAVPGAGAAGVEVPFEMLVRAHPARMLGASVADRFGASFPIRFDYLDTVEGGNLSMHCHPRKRYIKEVFGWDYTQHESYYVMLDGPDSQVYLGLREDADVEEFRTDARGAAELGDAFDVTRYVQAHPARRHDLYLIPAGTPHASGVDNLVLEISATPYLYSLRFYDWLRRDLSGELRPVHVDHAFANLDDTRRGDAVHDDLIPEPRTVRAGDGWAEVRFDAPPEIFFEIRRLEFDDAITDATDGRFHLLNLVEGERVRIETASGDVHDLAYAETLVIPAAVGDYRIRRVSGGPCRVVKALVRG